MTSPKPKIEGMITLGNGDVIQASEPTFGEFIGKDNPVFATLAKITGKDVEYLQNLSATEGGKVWKICTPIMERIGATMKDITAAPGTTHQ